MKTRLVDQIARPRSEGGCDWGTKRIVLVRLLKGRNCFKELWWTGGHKYWSCVGQPHAYAPTCLETAEPGSWSVFKSVGGAETVTREIQKGGRLSKKSITTNAAKINEFFGAEIADQIDITKTLILEEANS